jgi:hypothetical protein
MTHELNQRCAEFEPLLIRKITGELVPEEENFLEDHLAQCAACNSELEKVSRLWQGMESLPSAAVPPKLHDETQKAVLGLLRKERSFFYRLVGDSLKGAWSYLLPVITGLVLTALSYGLMANLIDRRVHHHHIVISVFALWAVLFVVASWLMFKDKVGRVSSVSVVITFSLSITFLTLLLTRLFSRGDVSGWIEGSWIDALFTGYFPALAHRFVIGWGSYACAGAFFGSLLFGLHKAPSVSKTAFLGSLIISVLLFPVIYLHGSSHGHSYGVIFFGALGIFFGASIGILLGNILRRQLSFSMA